MHFERLETSKNSLYLEAIELYKKSFPLHEQRDSTSQKEALSHGQYYFNLIYDEAEFVGILLCWETEQFIYVEHFCIQPEMRNNRYGQRTLELLNQKGKTVILEIDPPADTMAERRKDFYERAGYKLNLYKHVHPPYKENRGGHSLFIMSYPDVITQKLYDKFNQYLKTCVMGRENDS